MQKSPAVLATLILLFTLSPAHALTLYVSPTGNDTWLGNSPTHTDGTEGPFATIAHARDAIRAHKKENKGDLKAPINVVIANGTYFQDDTLGFTPEDTGQPDAPITYAAAPDAHPVLSTGRRITGWKTVQANKRNAWSVDLPSVQAGKWYFRELWINGQRRTRARHPNTGYLNVTGIDKHKEWNQGEWTQGTTWFPFAGTDLDGTDDLSQAEVIVFDRWVESRLPIESVDEKRRVVNFTKKSVFKLEANDPYYVENAITYLDQPGEWFLDNKAGTLFYLPMPGENPADLEAFAPAAEQVMRLSGRAVEGGQIEYLTFAGLTFSHSEWDFPKPKPGEPKPQKGGFGQAAIDVSGAVFAEGVRNCNFLNCKFTHLGSYGLELRAGCSNNTIKSCEFSDLGAGGIKIGEGSQRKEPAGQTHSNTITNCHIHHGGYLFASGIGLWMGQVYGNHISHNHIHDFYYTGISTGWTWGYAPTSVKNNTIEFNEIDHIGTRDGDGPILSDMGGIYTLGAQPGTQIRNNIFHDIAAFKYGGWGIYFDEGSANITAENNLVYRTTHGGFHQHYGKDNIVKNNIFALGRDAQIQRTRPEAHQSFTFENNIVYWSNGNLLAGDWSTQNVVFDHNTYWHTNGKEPNFDKWTLKEWQSKKLDENSIIANPDFTNPDQNNFTVKENSPALKTGFKPFDLSKVGSQ